MKYLYALPLLFAAPVAAAIPTPARPVTDPHSLVSPADPQAAPVPIDDLVFTRGVLDAAWSADGRQLFVSTNLTGRYNIWRMDADGSWPVQLTQSDDNQAGFAVSPDGRTLYLHAGQGRERAIRHLCRADRRRRVRNLTNTPDLREVGLLIAPDGRAMALSTKRSERGPEQPRGDRPRDRHSTRADPRSRPAMELERGRMDRRRPRADRQPRLRRRHRRRGVEGRRRQRQGDASCSASPT